MVLYLHLWTSLSATGWFLNVLSNETMPTFVAEIVQEQQADKVG
jgi:hypothetical protein